MCGAVEGGVFELPLQVKIIILRVSGLTKLIAIIN